MKSIIKALRKLFPHTIGVEPFVSSNISGDATYGASVDRKGRVKGQHIIVRDDQGREIVSTVNIVFAGAFDITAKDRFTLPASFTPQTPVAISVSTAADENGPHHDRVFFK